MGSHSLLGLGTNPNHRIEPRSPTLQADSLPSEPLGKPHKLYMYCYINIFYTLENLQKIKDKLKISSYFSLWPLAHLTLPEFVSMEPTALTDLWESRMIPLRQQHHHELAFGIPS